MLSLASLLFHPCPTIRSIKTIDIAELGCHVANEGFVTKGLTGDILYQFAWCVLTAVLVYVLSQPCEECICVPNGHFLFNFRVLCMVCLLFMEGSLLVRVGRHDVAHDSHQLFVRVDKLA